MRRKHQTMKMSDALEQGIAEYDFSELLNSEVKNPLTEQLEKVHNIILTLNDRLWSKQEIAEWLQEQGR